MTAVLLEDSARETGESTAMRVRKRNGAYEPADVNKIVRAVARSCEGLHDVDPLRVATKTISGLYDGATTHDLDRLSIQTAALLTAEEPQYSLLAARLLSTVIDKEIGNQEIRSFSQSVAAAYRDGIAGEELMAFVTGNARKLNDAIRPERDRLFEYFGLRTVYDRYLLRRPATREIIETPQYMFMRIACALARTPAEAIEFYDNFSALDYLPSSPTLFNAGTAHPQMSSCFLLDSPADDLEAIYRKYTDIALLSKFAGGIGVGYSRVRAAGSLIRGTNGRSSGIVPFLKTLDASVAAVNQGGKRKGAACVYLETWHADIEAFLELRDNTGDDARRTHNLNLANWIPDEFMRRVEANEDWSLFNPKDVPEFTDLYGAAFEQEYRAAEAAGRAVKSVPARDIYAKMMRTLAQTGNGWMCFKDRSNALSNQTAETKNVIHLSNLCTEILEVSSAEQTAVCNLGSVNLSRHVREGAFDFAKLARTVRTAVRQLDRVIDRTFYPLGSAGDGNRAWRPVGLGVMGLQDVFFALKIAFDSAAARELSARIAEEIYYNALAASCDLAEELGAHPLFAQTRAAAGTLHVDHFSELELQTERWTALRARIVAHGLRNSLLVAIAPTATIAAIAGCYECIEPQVSNLFKRETLSGEFLQINRYLVAELKQAGLWTTAIRTRIKAAEGSIAGIGEIPADVRERYRTAWELPQRALIDLAAARLPFIDQSQSLNLFMETPTIGKLSSMYAYAWKSGLKTTYYLRSRPATRIAKSTIDERDEPASAPALSTATADAIACSLENPESCEALPMIELALPPKTRTAILDPGFELSLRPMRYPRLYEMYKAAIANTWTVDEVDFSTDIVDLQTRVTPAQRHVISRLVAFFATGDTIVANNLVLNLYRHINAPEARMYLSRQLFEEAQHIQFYLTLLDTYLPSEEERAEAFHAIETIPSIARKGRFCFEYVDSLNTLSRIETEADRRDFVCNLAAFAAGVEGLFFFGAFAYVYYLRSRGLFQGLATGTNWVFRDESMHMAFAFEVLRIVREEHPGLFDAQFEARIRRMISDAVDVEFAFAEDVLHEGVVGLSLRDMRAYLEYVADCRLRNMSLTPQFHARNPFDFMELQDVQELTNFFERRVSAYQTGVSGKVDFDEDF